MPFKSSKARSAFFAGKKAAQQQGMGSMPSSKPVVMPGTPPVQNLTSFPSLGLPKLPGQLPDSAPELPGEEAAKKFPKIISMMKIPKIKKPKI